MKAAVTLKCHRIYLEYNPTATQKTSLKTIIITKMQKIAETTESFRTIYHLEPNFESKFPH